MTAHDFVGSQYLDIGTVALLRQSNLSLRNATLAIAALDASRRSRVLSSSERDRAGISALKTYRMSLATLRHDLGENESLKSDACLWTTFFLGIFEVTQPLVFHRSCDFHCNTR